MRYQKCLLPLLLALPASAFVLYAPHQAVRVQPLQLRIWRNEDGTGQGPPVERYKFDQQGEMATHPVYQQQQQRGANAQEPQIFGVQKQAHQHQRAYGVLQPSQYRGHTGQSQQGQQQHPLQRQQGYSQQPQDQHRQQVNSQEPHHHQQGGHSRQPQGQGQHYQQVNSQHPHHHQQGGHSRQPQGQHHQQVNSQQPQHHQQGGRSQKLQGQHYQQVHSQQPQHHQQEGRSREPQGQHHQQVNSQQPQHHQQGEHSRQPQGQRPHQANAQQPQHHQQGGYRGHQQGGYRGQQQRDYGGKQAQQRGDYQQPGYRDQQAQQSRQVTYSQQSQPLQPQQDSYHHQQQQEPQQYLQQQPYKQQGHNDFSQEYPKQQQVQFQPGFTEVVAAYEEEASYELSEAKNPYDDTAELITIRTLLKGTVLEEEPLQLIYDAEKNGWDAQTFHSLVDHKGPAIVVGTHGGKQIVGGYNPRGWSSGGGSLDSVAAFLFYERLSGELSKLRKVGGPNGACAVDDPEFGIYFGFEDLQIGFRNGQVQHASSKLGRCYEQRAGEMESLFPDPTGTVELVSLCVYAGVNYRPQNAQAQQHLQTLPQQGHEFRDFNAPGYVSPQQNYGAPPQQQDYGSPPQQRYVN